ncbi:MAG: low molecular weight protein arginine phosphatase [Lentisphaeria bacterium]|nr:low molecular weight protein arginine phosphatase [Lentisphaeria bacterium]
MVKKVLFVCTGNTCRSPMAERYFNTVAAGRITAASAGLYADAGSPMSFGAVRALAQYGIGEDDFRASQFEPELAEQADLIVGMTDSHCREVVKRYPAGAAKTVPLLQFTTGGSVADPFGGSDTEYRHCLEQMIPALENLMEYLLKKQTNCNK